MKLELHIRKCTQIFFLKPVLCYLLDTTRFQNTTPEISRRKSFNISAGESKTAKNENLISVSNLTIPLLPAPVIRQKGFHATSTTLQFQIYPFIQIFIDLGFEKQC